MRAHKSVTLNPFLIPLQSNRPQRSGRCTYTAAVVARHPCSTAVPAAAVAVAIAQLLILSLSCGHSLPVRTRFKINNDPGGHDHCLGTKATTTS